MIIIILAEQVLSYPRNQESFPIIRRDTETVVRERSWNLPTYRGMKPFSPRPHRGAIQNRDSRFTEGLSTLVVQLKSCSSINQVPASSPFTLIVFEFSVSCAYFADCAAPCRL